MSMNPGGDFTCDRCGKDVENGAITVCAIVSDIDPETRLIRNLHFCRDEADEEGKIVRKGCVNKLLSASILKHYNETRENKPA